MNSYSFFYDNFGKHFEPARSNKAHMDASAVLRGSHKMKKLDAKDEPKRCRLAYGWAIIRPTVSSIKLELDVPNIQLDPRNERDAFLEELKSWDNTPRIFLVFKKAPIPISNLFLTLDLRMVRVCTPKGVDSFDFTKSFEETGSKFHESLVRLDRKNAA